MEKTLFKTENIFFVICLLWGVIFLFINPPFQAPDEFEHFFKMWGYTQGTLRHEIQGGISGLELPESFVKLYDFYDYYRRIDTKLPFEATAQAGNIALEKGKTEFLSFNPSSYTPLSYFPSFIVLWFLKIFSIKPLMMLYIMRFCSLLVYLALCYCAIKITPCLKWTIWMFSLLPVNIYQAAAVSVDGLTFGLIVLFFAYTLKLAFDENIKNIDIKRILLWGIMFAYICILKYAYFPLIVVYFLIPAEKFSSKKTYFKYLSIVAGICFGLICVFLSAVMSTPVLNEHTKTFLINDKIDLIKQIILSPFDYLKKVLVSTYILRGFLYRNIISSVSVFFKMIPFFAVNIAYISLILSVFYKTVKEQACKISLKQKGLIVAAILVSYLLIVTSVYLIYKSQTYIVGIQGRYLTPLILFGLIVFAFPKFNISNKIVPVFLFFVSQFLLLCTFVTIIGMYV